MPTVFTDLRRKRRNLRERHDQQSFGHALGIISERSPGLVTAFVSVRGRPGTKPVHRHSIGLRVGLRRGTMILQATEATVHPRLQAQVGLGFSVRVMPGSGDFSWRLVGRNLAHSPMYPRGPMLGWPWVHRQSGCHSAPARRRPGLSHVPSELVGWPDLNRRPLRPEPR
jgi:hypothetical protein